MIEAAVPINEKFRLEALKSLDILDTDSQKEFDDITSLVSFVCGTDISLICLVDSERQWFKAKDGTTIKESPRNYSICSHAILQPNQPFIINDTRKDNRFIDELIFLEGKPVIFYAGIPLVDKNGFALGTLNTMAHKPMELSEKQIESLQALAKQVIILFELNKKNKDLQEAQDKLTKNNESLKEFARVISHDLKMPLANIVTTSDLLLMKLEDIMDIESKEYFGYIKESSFTMSSYISDVLMHYESDSLIKHEPEKFNLNELLEEITNLLSIKSDCSIRFAENNPTPKSNKLALKQVFFNLIGNSIKYNDKEQIEISVSYNEDKLYHYFAVADNGMGIPKNKIDTIFDLFTTANALDRSGNKGNGIGLSTVRNIVNQLGGTINVTSDPGISTTFNFSIKK